MTLSPNILDFIPLDFGDKKERELSFSPNETTTTTTKGNLSTFEKLLKTFSTRWATSETGPGDLLHDRKNPKRLCVLFLFLLMGFYYFLLRQGGRYTTLSSCLCDNSTRASSF